FARCFRNIINRDAAYYLRVFLKVVEAERVYFSFNEEVRDLKVFLKMKYEAACEVGYRRLDLFLADRLADYARYLFAQPFNRAVEVFGRCAYVSDEAPRVNARARRDAAESGVSKALFVAQYSRNARRESGACAQNRIHHQQRVVIRV